MPERLMHPILKKMYKKRQQSVETEEGDNYESIYYG